MPSLELEEKLAQFASMLLVLVVIGFALVHTLEGVTVGRFDLTALIANVVPVSGQASSAMPVSKAGGDRATDAARP